MAHTGIGRILECDLKRSAWRRFQFRVLLRWELFVMVFKARCSLWNAKFNLWCATH